MKFYLSSYKIGKETEKLKELAHDKKIGFIPNSLDYVEPKARQESKEKNMKDLSDLGIDVEMLDLKDYFGKKEELKKKIDSLGGVWIRGGNTFVLRQAMKISGFDEIIKNIDRDDFLYGGYSAGICILAPSLKALQQVDKPDIMPYEESKEVIWDGLGILNYIILPHYKSDHPESTDIDKEVEFCKKNNIPFKTLRDGEVIIIE
jgi:dipeptidase E